MSLVPEADLGCRSSAEPAPETGNVSERFLFLPRLEDVPGDDVVVRVIEVECFSDIASSSKAVHRVSACANRDHAVSICTERVP